AGHRAALPLALGRGMTRQHRSVHPAEQPGDLGPRQPAMDDDAALEARRPDLLGDLVAERSVAHEVASEVDALRLQESARLQEERVALHASERSVAR